jgi:hypothetical protein
MAKFITIATTVAGAQPNLFNVDNILAVSWLTATTFAIYSGPRSYTFTTSAAGAASVVAAVNTAMFSIAGPTVVAVEIPAGVTIGALPVVAIT